MKIPKASNYKTFDYAENMKTKYIYGSIKPNGNIKIFKGQYLNKIYVFSNSVKLKMEENLDRIASENSGLVKRNSSSVIQRTFQMRLLKISGQAVYIIFWRYQVLMCGIILVGIKMSLDALKVTRRRASIISIILLIFFMILTGFTPSCVRACIMAIMAKTAVLIHRKSNAINNMCFVLLLTLIYNPYNINNTSILLSYGGVIGILGFFQIIKDFMDNKIRKNGKVIEYLKTTIGISLSVQIMIAPIMMYFHKTTSFTFLVANILSGALISVIIIYGFAIVLVSFIQIDLAGILGVPYKIIVKIFVGITEITSKIPFSKVYVKTPYIWQIVFYYLLLFVFWYLIKTNKFQKIKKFKNQIIAIILVIVIIPGITDNMPKNDLRLYFIDVEQGDSCLIVTPKNKKVLIDGGGSENYDIRQKYFTSIFTKSKDKQDRLHGL